MIGDALLCIVGLLAGGFVFLWVILCTPVGERIGWVAEEPPHREPDEN